ncbi:carbon-phosphorus lyase complex subunit PhnI [Nocardia sp. NPDC059239]|uniref:carbon-phosphorus lyase complex subunit PhnI n=1 Tax=Nocardia sp. NPDC059239 TaxID=3346785 RepID=UPI0036A2AD70
MAGEPLMAYRSPGLDAIEAATRLVARRHDHDPSQPLGLDQVKGRLRLMVDQVMSEGGLWDEDTAARAFGQAEGDSVEAAHLVRTYRLSLPQLATTAVTDVAELVPLRRIVPVYRTPPGRQILGQTRDYLPRLLRTNETAASDEDHDHRRPDDMLATPPAAPGPRACDTSAGPWPERIHELLEARDLVVSRSAPGDPDPVDVASEPRILDQDRSARLYLLARAETAALVLHWYTHLLNEGQMSPAVGGHGEVRVGRLPVRVPNPLTGGCAEVGEVRVTEAEAIENLDRHDEDTTRFDVGYGLCFGQNERKALAISNLDIILERDRGRSEFEQLVLRTADGMDANGLLEHVKLPHYVTFRAAVDTKAELRARNPHTDTGEAE